MTKDKIIVKAFAGQRFIEVGGKRLRLMKEEQTKEGHVGEMTFSEIPEAEWDAMVTEIARRLIAKSGLTVEAIVKDVLSYLPLDELQEIDRTSKRKPVTIEKGCLNLKVGRHEIAVGGGV